jgi:hypothetical protein
VPRALGGFIGDLCTPDAAQRPSAAQALAHPYLADCAGLEDSELSVGLV